MAFATASYVEAFSSTLLSKQQGHEVPGLFSPDFVFFLFWWWHILGIHSLTGSCMCSCGHGKMCIEPNRRQVHPAVLRRFLQNPTSFSFYVLWLD